jgi:hypothetical protein
MNPRGLISVLEADLFLRGLQEAETLWPELLPFGGAWEPS